MSKWLINSLKSVHNLMNEDPGKSRILLEEIIDNVSKGYYKLDDNKVLEPEYTPPTKPSSSSKYGQVRCINASKNQSMLTEGNIYDLLECIDYRNKFYKIISDEGNPYMFNKYKFELL